jgi:hypothetical protein
MISDEWRSRADTPPVALLNQLARRNFMLGQQGISRWCSYSSAGFGARLASQLLILVTGIVVVVVNNIGNEYRSVLRLSYVKGRRGKLLGRTLLPVRCWRSCSRAQGD